MKFTLILYTNEWEQGPTVELGHVPAPGNVIWVRERKNTGGHEMFYVDNIMYAEEGINNDNTVYLFVRPYVGYGKYLPKTEADRIVETLVKVTNGISELRQSMGAVSASVESICNHRERNDIRAGGSASAGSLSPRSDNQSAGRQDMPEGSEQFSDRTADLIYTTLEEINDNLEKLNETVEDIRELNRY